MDKHHFLTFDVSLLLAGYIKRCKGFPQMMHLVQLIASYFDIERLNKVIIQMLFFMNPN
jgi:hypothetical protein